MSTRTEIFKGTTHELNVYVKRRSNGAPVDCTGATAAVASFCGDDGTPVEKTLGAGVTLESGEGGHFKVSLATADTDLLKADERLGWEIKITTPSWTKRFRFPESLDVIAAFSC